MPRPPMQRPGAGRWTIGRLMGAIAVIAVALAVVRAGGAVVVILFGVPGSYSSVVVLAARYGRRRGRSGLASGAVAGGAVLVAVAVVTMAAALLTDANGPPGFWELAGWLFVLVWICGVWGTFFGLVISSVYLCLAEIFFPGPSGEAPGGVTEAPGPERPDGLAS